MPRVFNAGFIFALTVGCAVLFRLGYQNLSGDQVQYLLLPFREIFPQFAPRDWTVWSTTHYHPAFAILIEGVHALCGDFWRVGYFILWLATVGATIDAGTRIAKVCKLDQIGIGALIVLLAHFGFEGVGMTPLLNPVLIPSQIAAPILLYSIQAALEQRVFRAFALMALATLIHINYGIVGLPFLLALCWNSHRYADRKVVLSMMLFLCATLPLVPLILRTLPGDSELLELLLIRSPHHYDVTQFDRVDVIRLMGLLGYVLLGTCSHSKIEALRGLRGAVLTTSCLLCLAWFFSTVWPIDFVIRSFPWRITPFLVFLAYIFVAADLDGEESRGRAFIFIGILSFTTLAGRTSIDSAVLWSLVLMLALSTLGILRQHERRTSLLGVFLLSYVILTTGLAETGQRASTLAKFRWKSDSLLYAWISEHVSPFALMLIPPDMENFRLETGRSTVVDFKSAPIVSSVELSEWRNRLQDVSGMAVSGELGIRGNALKKLLGNVYERQSAIELQQLAAKYDADCFLMREKWFAIESELVGHRFVCEQIQSWAVCCHAASFMGLDPWNELKG